MVVIGLPVNIMLSRCSYARQSVVSANSLSQFHNILATYHENQ